MHLDSFGLGVAYNNRPSVIVAGAGTKVWFKNTLASTRADGRVIAAVTMVDFTIPPVPMGYLTWNGTIFTPAGATFANSMLRTTWVDAANLNCEAVLTR